MADANGPASAGPFCVYVLLDLRDILKACLGSLGGALLHSLLQLSSRGDLLLSSICFGFVRGGDWL